MRREGLLRGGEGEGERSFTRMMFMNRSTQIPHHHPLYPHHPKCHRLPFLSLFSGNRSSSLLVFLCCAQAFATVSVLYCIQARPFLCQSTDLCGCGYGAMEQPGSVVYSQCWGEARLGLCDGGRGGCT